MASPAFIYSFDNLGPYRFIDLCAELLGARYKGFVLGGVGADGGVDGEIDHVLGEWHPEASDALSSLIIEPGQTVVFQFKHKVTARTGQANARRQLLAEFTGTNSEVNKSLIVNKRPDVYMLITNIEVNSQFRDEFQVQCRASNPNIRHYQVIGLDDLEKWVTQATNLRHLYFPTIFDLPRYNLRLSIDEGAAIPSTGGIMGLIPSASVPIVIVTVYNIGTMPSYIENIFFKTVKDGKEELALFLPTGRGDLLNQMNPQLGTVLETGRNAQYRFLLEGLKITFNGVFLSEIVFTDEIQNIYSIPVPESIRQKISGV